jgi:hypothetical protein
MLFLFFLLILFEGCTDSSEVRSADTVTRSGGGVPKSDLLARQLELGIGTRGTFEKDFEEASLFIHSLSEDDVRRFPVSPREYLVKGYDLTYMEARKLAETPRVYMPEGIIDYLVFCRLLRNAFHESRKECQDQLLRDSMTAITYFRRATRNERREYFDTFRGFSDLCQSMWNLPLTVCRKKSLQWMLALKIMRLNRTHQSRLISGTILWVMQYLSMFFLDYSRCKDETKRHVYKELFRSITSELVAVLHPSLIAQCHDEQIAFVMERIQRLTDPIEHNSAC